MNANGFGRVSALLVERGTRRAVAAVVVAIGSGRAVAAQECLSAGAARSGSDPWCCGGVCCVNGACQRFVGAGEIRAFDAECSPSQSSSFVCEDNGSWHGKPVCCGYAGADSADDSRCCGVLTRAHGAWGAAPVVVYGGLPCGADAECGGEAVSRSCDDNGTYDDGPLHCCRPAAGARSMPIAAARTSASTAPAAESAMDFAVPTSDDHLDPYAAIPDLYDLEHASFADDLPLYVNVAEAVGDPILELGCGSGRVVLPLAEAGFRVTGLDRSAPMLQRAAAAVESAGVAGAVTLHRGDLREADSAPGGPFGLVLIPLNGLLHLAEPVAQRAALAAARRALDPRGQLVIDVFNPTPEVLRGFDRTVVHEGSWELPDGSRVDKFGSRRLHAAEQTIETDLWYDVTDRAGAVKRVRTRYPMRYLHRAELELLLELTGFPEWEVYGSYDLDPFEDGADRLLVLAEATASRR